MLTDFYGRILVPAAEVEHTQACFVSMIESLRMALEQAGIRDQIVVIERTGRYHRPGLLKIRQPKAVGFPPFLLRFSARLRP